MVREVTSAVVAIVERGEAKGAITLELPYLMRQNSGHIRSLFQVLAAALAE